MFDLRQFAAIAPDEYLRLQYHGELESTNDEAHRIAREGAEHGTVVLAENQTRGRGRRGADWLSEPGDGLLFSVVLRPQFEAKYRGRIALAAGLGIASVLRESLGVPAELKWPNDLMIHGKKCGGILVEAQENHVVLGVGINVIQSPSGGDFIAVNDASGDPVSREKVFALLLPVMLREVECCADDFVAQIDRIRGISWLQGKQIRFLSGEDEHQGEVAGIAPDGSLAVRVGGVTRNFIQASGIRCC